MQGIETDVLEKLPVRLESRSIRVLIVEDSRLQQRYLCRILEKEPGIAVAGIAGSGQEARELTEKLKPDVITLDLHLSDVMEFELLEYLVSCTKIPVIVVSSLPQFCEQAIRMGAGDFLEKLPDASLEAAKRFAALLPLKIRAQVDGRYEREQAENKVEAGFQNESKSEVEGGSQNESKAEAEGGSQNESKTEAEGNAQKENEAEAEGSSKNESKAEAEGSSPNESETKAEGNVLKENDAAAEASRRNENEIAAEKGCRGRTKAAVETLHKKNRKKETNARSVKARGSDRLEVAGRTEGTNAAAKEETAVQEERARFELPVIAVGASLGGTESTLELLRELPADMPPILIVQHMPVGYTRAYAMRLNRYTSLEVREAKDGERLKAGRVLVAESGKQLQLVRGREGYYVRSRRPEKVLGFCPSADILFSSVAEQALTGIGIILTGMGSDGAEGIRRMHEKGFYTMGQNRESCAVYGMPQAAKQLGALDTLLSPRQIAARLVEKCRRCQRQEMQMPKA